MVLLRLCGDPLVFRREQGVPWSLDGALPFGVSLQEGDAKNRLLSAVLGAEGMETLRGRGLGGLGLFFCGPDGRVPGARIPLSESPDSLGLAANDYVFVGVDHARGLAPPPPQPSLAAPSSRSAAAAGTLCVVCGKKDTEGVPRKSGFKCTECVGKKSKESLRARASAKDMGASGATASGTKPPSTVPASGRPLSPQRSVRFAPPPVTTGVAAYSQTSPYHSMAGLPPSPTLRGGVFHPEAAAVPPLHVDPDVLSHIAHLRNPALTRDLRHHQYPGPPPALPELPPAPPTMPTAPPSRNRQKSPLRNREMGGALSSIGIEDARQNPDPVPPSHTPPTAAGPVLTPRTGEESVDRGGGGGGDYERYDEAGGDDDDDGDGDAYYGPLEGMERSRRSRSRSRRAGRAGSQPPRMIRHKHPIPLGHRKPWDASTVLYAHEEDAAAAVSEGRAAPRSPGAARPRGSGEHPVVRTPPSPARESRLQAGQVWPVPAEGEASAADGGGGGGDRRRGIDLRAAELLAISGVLDKELASSVPPQPQPSNSVGVPAAVGELESFLRDNQSSALSPPQPPQPPQRPVEAASAATPAYARRPQAANDQLHFDSPGSLPPYVPPEYRDSADLPADARESRRLLRLAYLKGTGVAPGGGGGGGGGGAQQQQQQHAFFQAAAEDYASDLPPPPQQLRLPNGVSVGGGGAAGPLGRGAVPLRAGGRGRVLADRYGLEV